MHATTEWDPWCSLDLSSWPAKHQTHLVHCQALPYHLSFADGTVDHLTMQIGTQACMQPIFQSYKDHKPDSCGEALLDLGVSQTRGVGRFGEEPGPVDKMYPHSHQMQTCACSFKSACPALPPLLDRCTHVLHMCFTWPHAHART